MVISMGKDVLYKLTIQLNWLLSDTISKDKFVTGSVRVQLSWTKTILGSLLTLHFRKQLWNMDLIQKNNYLEVWEGEEKRTDSSGKCICTWSRENEKLPLVFSVASHSDARSNCGGYMWENLPSFQGTRRLKLESCEHWRELGVVMYPLPDSQTTYMHETQSISA